MKRPNKKDYNFNDSIDGVLFAKHMIDYADYLEQKLSEAEKQVKNIKDDALLATAPYQCCPVCNGTGQTIADGFTSSVFQTCKVCNGAMIIPQHIVT